MLCGKKGQPSSGLLSHHFPRFASFSRETTWDDLLLAVTNSVLGLLNQIAGWLVPPTFPPFHCPQSPFNLVPSSKNLGGLPDFRKIKVPNQHTEDCLEAMYTGTPFKTKISPPTTKTALSNNKSNLPTGIFMSYVSFSWSVASPWSLQQEAGGVDPFRRGNSTMVTGAKRWWWFGTGKSDLDVLFFPTNMCFHLSFGNLDEVFSEGITLHYWSWAAVYCSTWLRPCSRRRRMKTGGKKLQ